MTNKSKKPVSKSANTSKDLEQLSFEQAYEQLEKLIEKIEAEELPLEQALQFFEQGIQLTQQCRHLLTDAQRRVTQLLDGQEIPLVLDETAP